MTKKSLCLSLDVVLTLLLVLEMLYAVTGNTIHEVLGLVFCLGVVAHLALSASWIRSALRGIADGEAGKRMIPFTLMVVLLLVDMVLLAVSSVAISRLLGGANDAVCAMLPYSTWYTMHVVASYGLSALVLIHLVMHWQMLAKWLRIPYNPERRAVISNCANAVAGIGAIALLATCAGTLAPLGKREPANARGADSWGFDRSEKPEREQFYGSEKGEHPGRGWDQRNSSDDQGAQESGSESSGLGTGSGGSSGSADDSATTQYCTLCRKRCPLTAPKCDLPYQEGLL